MKKKRSLLISCTFMLFNAACTHQEAAMIGSVIGRPIGYPLGVTAVAVEEAFGTASDITKASTRSISRVNNKDLCIIL